MTRQGLKKMTVIVTTFVAVFVLLLFVFKYFHASEVTYENTAPLFEYNGEQYFENTDLMNFLFIGTDTLEPDERRGYYTPVRADFLVLVSVDIATEEYTMLHINRDTITEVDRFDVKGDWLETRLEQIALAYSHGNNAEKSCANTSNSVSKLLCGIDIDYYISMDMKALQIINDYMGGVTVTFDADYTDISPDYTSGNTVTLDGEAALKFVRSRMGVQDGTNTARMERQKLYIDAFINRLTEKNLLNEDFLQGVLEETGEHISTDCHVNNIDRLFSQLANYECSAIHSIKGETKVGKSFMEFYPDTDAVNKLVAENYCYKDDVY